MHYIIRFEGYSYPSGAKKQDLVDIVVDLYAGMTMTTFRSRAHKMAAHYTRCEINKAFDLDSNTMATWPQMKLADFYLGDVCLPVDDLKKAILKKWASKWEGDIYDCLMEGTRGIRSRAEFGEQVDENIKEYVRETAVHEWFDFAKLN
jgi:hypothetical protein